MEWVIDGVSYAGYVPIAFDKNGEPDLDMMVGELGQMVEETKGRNRAR